MTVTVFITATTWSLVAWDRTLRMMVGLNSSTVLFLASVMRPTRWGFMIMPPLTMALKAVMSWMPVTANPWPKAIVALSTLVQEPGGLVMPEGSPGKSIPVGSSRPKASMHACMSLERTGSMSFAMPMLLLYLMMSLTGSQPYFSWSWMVTRWKVKAPFSQKMLLDMPKDFFSRPHDTHRGLMTDPGSKLWVMAMFACPARWR